MVTNAFSRSFWRALCLVALPALVWSLVGVKAAQAQPAEADATLRVEAPRGSGDVIPRALVSFGALPRPAFGAGLAGHVRIARRLSVLGALTYFPEVRTESERAAMGLTMGTLGACLEPFTLDPGGPIDGLDACLAAELGALHAVSYGEPLEDAGDSLWLAGVGQVRAVRQLAGPAVLELGGGLAVPALRHELVVSGEQGYLFRTSSVTAQLWLGVGAVF
jgi:hypothetical protein